MRRVSCAPRDGWREVVESQGLTYAVDRSPGADGGIYWDEGVRYELTEAEVDYLDRVTGELHAMTVEAVRHMATDPVVLARHRLPDGAARLIAASAEAVDDPEQLSLYGRFDLAWGGDGEAKLLEYNADTPAGLVEAGVCQWLWLEDLHPDRDQWNLVHEYLVRAWSRLRARTGVRAVHFAVGQHEPTEDWATVAYLRDTAQEAGLVALGITMEEIGWDHGDGRFVDLAGLPITHCFKMYPTEWMLAAPFGSYLLSGASTTRWIEPAWKLLAGSKALLPVLWKLFPDHPNLLRAHFDHPHGMPAYAAKPLFGWEGDGVRIVAPDGVEAARATHSAGQEVVYQEYVRLPDFGGNRPVLGTWVVDGMPAGLGIRESVHLITDTRARFVPHLMLAPRSTPEQVAAWLAEP